MVSDRVKDWLLYLSITAGSLAYLGAVIDLIAAGHFHR